VNPRQRRGVLLLGISILGAVAVFFLVSGYVADVEAQVGPTRTAYRLTRDVPVHTSFTESMVEETAIPERYIPPSAITSRAELLGLVAAGDLTEGSLAQAGMFRPPPEVEPGQREIAILVDAETGVAGRVRPGDLVDIYATFEGDEARPSRSEVIVTNARIVAVGTPSEQPSGEGDGFTTDTVVPVTFALSTQESLVLTYAESFAVHVRLALVGAGDDTPVPASDRLYQLGAADDADADAATEGTGRE
jgi:pilus assembly protein CpaB